MEEYLQRVLDDADIGSLLKISAQDFQQNIKSNIVKIIFYSSAIEGNKLDVSTAELLLNGKIVSKEGRFQDYIEILNHGEVYRRLIKISKRDVTIKDMIDLRTELFDGIPDKYRGLRRYRNGVGEYITSPPSRVERELLATLKIINTKPASPVDAFLNALEFHLKIAHLHPFEDGVGRTTRLFMNLYLMKSGLMPIIISDEDNKLYRNSLSFYHFTGYTVSFVANMLIFSFEKTELHKLLEKVKRLDEKEPHNLEFRDIILQLTSNIDGAKLRSDIELLYKKGTEEKDIELALSGLWLSRNSKIDTSIVRKAMASDNYRLRAGAVLAAGQIDIAKYGKYIKKLALGDDNEYNRILAIAVLARAKLLDSKLVEEIIEKENGEVALSALSEYLTWIDASPLYLKSIRKLMKNTSVNVSSRAHEAFINHADERMIVESVISLMQHKDSVIQQSIIGQLRYSGKQFNPTIASALSDVAILDKGVRTLLLGSISSKDKMVEEFMPFLDEIMKSKDSTQEERAYAIYLIGIYKGVDYLKNEYKVNVGNGHNTLENIASFLAYTHALEKDSAISPNKEYVFSLDDGKLNLVQCVELARLTKSNRFGTGFLELCLMDLRQWNLD